jgi:hypothetical protein
LGNLKHLIRRLSPLVKVELNSFESLFHPLVKEVHPRKKYELMEQQSGTQEDVIFHGGHHKSTKQQ